LEKSSAFCAAQLFFLKKKTLPDGRDAAGILAKPKTGLLAKSLVGLGVQLV
jgi:hypothetical protein